MKTVALAAAVALGLWAGAAAAQTPPENPALTAYLREKAQGASGETRYTAAITPDGETTLVYLTGPHWCGSGGCQLLVLSRQGDAFVSIGEISVARAPIRLLERQRQGRPDIGVYVSGGGVVEGYEAAVPFDGRRYASNPTVAPAVRVEGAPGETLIRADEQGRVLEPSPDKP